MEAMEQKRPPPSESIRVSRSRALAPALVSTIAEVAAEKIPPFADERHGGIVLLSPYSEHRGDAFGANASPSSAAYGRANTTRLSPTGGLCTKEPPVATMATYCLPSLPWKVMGEAWALASSL